MLFRIAAFVLVAASIAGPASAQLSADAPSESADERARVMFEEGVRLVEAGRTDEALAVFEEAFTISPRASTAYNIAWVLFSQGRPRAALHALNRADPFPMTDEERAAIDTLRARLRPELATVVVHVSPESATVCVDDICDAAGTAVRTIIVDAGTRVVRCSATNHAPRESTITTVAGSTARVQVQLTALPPLLVPRSVDEARRQREALEARHRRRVRRAAWISSGTASTLAVVLGVMLTRGGEPTPYGGIDLGQRP